MQHLKQPQFNYNNDWVNLPRWRKRINGFASYFAMAFYSLLVPEIVDWVLYNDLKEEFLDESRHLQCCGNCKMFCDQKCPHKERIDDDQIEYYPADYVCDCWVNDRMNRTQRLIR